MANQFGPYTVSTFPIECHVGESIRIIPIGDVHRTTKRCAEEKYKETLDKVKRMMTEMKVYIIGMGDYDDFMSMGERINIERCELHETTEDKLDEVMERHVEIFAREWECFQGRILGMLEGNHYGRFFRTGVTTTQKLCEKLKCEYLGGPAFVRLQIKLHGKSTRAAVDIFAHHIGTGGGGRTKAASINSVDRMANVGEADIYLAAHDHQKWLYSSTRVRLSHGGKTRTQDREIILGRTGSFYLGYVENTKSYISHKLLTPANLGCIYIDITPRIVYDNRRQIDGKEYRDGQTVTFKLDCGTL